MPFKQSTADTIIEYGNRFGVSIFLDGDPNSDSARMGTEYTFYEEDKILTIFITNLKPNTEEKIIPFLQEKWGEWGVILKTSQEDTLESYISYKEDNTDKELLEFYSDKIPPADLDAFKMSLFQRSKQGIALDINSFKQQIRDRFGERGTYISNLCNSGYFEGELKNFYKVDPDGFDRFYELSVGRELLAIFVHAGMTHATFKRIFESKLILCRRYHFDLFRVHGLGWSNVNFINEIIKEYQEENDEQLNTEFTIEKVEDIEQPRSIVYDIRIV